MSAIFFFFIMVTFSAFIMLTFSAFLFIGACSFNDWVDSRTVKRGLGALQSFKNFKK